MVAAPADTASGILAPSPGAPDRPRSSWRTVPPTYWPVGRASERLISDWTSSLLGSGRGAVTASAVIAVAKTLVRCDASERRRSGQLACAQPSIRPQTAADGAVVRVDVAVGAPTVGGCELNLPPQVCSAGWARTRTLDRTMSRLQNPGTKTRTRWCHAGSRTRQVAKAGPQRCAPIRVVPEPSHWRLWPLSQCWSRYSRWCGTGPHR